jgi:predicted acyl esterase
MRRVVLVVAVLGSLLVVPSVEAAPIPSVFGGSVLCSNFDNGTPGNPADDQQRCGENGTNEVETLTINATGGTFKLVFFGQPTAAIAFDATPAAVEAALDALPQTDVAVTGAAGGPYTITFVGVLAKTDVDELIGDPTGLTGGAMTATVVTNTDGLDPSTTATWDGMPIDVNVAFPGASTSGPYPLLIWGHGYGGSKIGFSAMKRFTDRGYAVFSMTARGFHESCGTPASKAKAPAACAAGWVHLMDTRYEIRDAQELAAKLADEDVVDPQRIGALGASYGGGLSMALAALKDRKMMPDDSLVPWVSPVDAEPMRIAGAAPSVPWTDLAYALVPNGSTLDYVTDAPYAGRFGVMKQSLVTGLYLSGQLSEGFYAPQGEDPSADLTGWKALLDAGEPYDGNPAAAAILEEITTHHSSYYIDHSQPPAPILISSGFTDDLFPVDEAIRFYNRTRTEFPSTPIKLLFGDFGHPRAANKADVSQVLTAREDAWLDFYVKGTGAAPAQGVETFTQTCPNTSGTPSGGPFTAGNWAQLPLGEVALGDAGAKTVAPAVSDAAAGTFDPVSSGGNPCRTAPAGDQAGTASYRLPAVAGNGYTLMGAATVIADISSPTANSQLAARLLDVDPGGQETLVSRAVLRPAVGSAKQVFQLHPNGWRFAPGHVAKLELLPADSTGGELSSYAQASNGQGEVTVSNLELRLPVLEKPGAAGGAVRVPHDKFVPAGYTLTADAAAIANDANATIAAGKLKGSRKFLNVPVGSPAEWEACHATIEVVRAGAATAAAKRKKGKLPLLIASGSATVPGGTTGVAKLTLTKQARKRLAGRKVQVTVRLVTAEQDGLVTATRTAVFPKKKKKKKK